MNLSPRILLPLAVTALLAGCSTNRPDTAVAYVERPAESIYADAFRSMDRNQYDVAAAQFDEVERQHPYSEWARRSMLMAAPRQQLLPQRGVGRRQLYVQLRLVNCCTALCS